MDIAPKEVVVFPGIELFQKAFLIEFGSICAGLTLSDKFTKQVRHKLTLRELFPEKVH